jgi:hypothetical protein
MNEDLHEKPRTLVTEYPDMLARQRRSPRCGLGRHVQT